MDLPNSLVYLLLSWGLVTASLGVLLTYRGALSRMEDDSLYLNKDEETLMVGRQDVLIAKLSRLARPIHALAVLSGGLLLAVVAVWLWTGFQSF